MAVHADVAIQTAIPDPSSAEAVFCAICADCIGNLDRYLAEFMETGSPEGPHKARVALRRLTTALDAFKPLMRKADAKALRTRAKAIFRRLGTVRDADVYDQTKGDGRVSAETEALREVVRTALRQRKALEFGPLIRRKLSDGTLLRFGASGLRLRRSPAAVLARKATDEAFVAVGSHGKMLIGMDDQTRHEFRKDLKSLRYLTDFFVTPDAEPKRFTDLEALQDLLGTLNDLANARQREKTAHRHARKTQRRGKAELAALKQADVLWARLRKAAPWWQAISA